MKQVVITNPNKKEYTREEIGVIRQLMKMKKRRARWVHIAKSPLEATSDGRIGNGPLKKKKP